MKLNKSTLYFFLLLLAFSVILYFFNDYKNSQALEYATKLAEERAKETMIFNQLVKEDAELRVERDSLRIKNEKQQAIIDYQRENNDVKTIIHENYINHQNIANLSNSAAYIHFTDGAAEYIRNRGRYNVSRFQDLR